MRVAGDLRAAGATVVVAAAAELNGRRVLSWSDGPQRVGYGADGSVAGAGAAPAEAVAGGGGSAGAADGG